MISTRSVLALNNEFVTVDRLIPPQMMRGYSNPTMLLNVLPYLSYGILLETEYYNIITSPQQYFITPPKNATRAEDISIGEEVLTVYGFQPIKTKVFLNNKYKMCNIVTESGVFLSDGFYMLSD